jgi:hypothetical protein
LIFKELTKGAIGIRQKTAELLVEHELQGRESLQGMAAMQRQVRPKGRD